MTTWVVVCQIGEESPLVYLYDSKERALQHAVSLLENRIVSRHAKVWLSRSNIR